MQLTLNQNEIEQAIKNYVGNLGVALSGKDVDITLVAGRGEKGITATLDITDHEIQMDVKVEDTAPDVDPPAEEETTNEEQAEPTEDGEPEATAPLFGGKKS